MSDEIKRNESTENGRKIWEAVERAASRAPEWVKQQVRDTKHSQGADASKPEEKRPKGNDGPGRSRYELGEHVEGGRTG